MKVQPTVRNETVRMAIGTGILTLVMVLVFVIIGKFDYTVLLGALLGWFAATANFFLLGLSVQNAAEKMNGTDGDEESAKENSKRAKSAMQFSYVGRMFLSAGVAILAIAVPCFNALAGILPLLFPQFVIFYNKLVRHV